MLIAALAIAKAWKQPECHQQVNEDMMCICSRILLGHKKNEKLSFAVTWMDLETIILCEVSQTEINIL